MSSAMEYLQGRGVPYLVLPHPHAETVLDTARRHGFHTDEVVKTVVVTTRYGNALLVLRNDREAVEELVVAAFGDEEVGMVGERDLLRNYPDHEPGSIPPLGLFFQAPMYVDVDVAIRMLTKDLFRDDPVVIGPLTRESEEAERHRAQALTVEEPDLAVTESVSEDEPVE